MKYKKISTLTPVLGRFFTQIRIFPDQIRILVDPDPDSEKKSDPDPGKKPGSETLRATNMGRPRAEVE